MGATWNAAAVSVMLTLAGSVRAEVGIELHAFCNPCRRPDALYGGDLSYLNFDAGNSKIPRSTPDGENPWPNAMADGWPTNPATKCNALDFPNPCFEYTTKDRAGWWDDYADQQALPTHAWFTDVFLSSPIIVLPQVFHWPIFQVPYSVIAANDGLSVTLPRYQVATNGGIPGQAGDIKSDVTKGVTPEVSAGGVDRELILTSVGNPSFPLAERRIANYDRNTLHVDLTYRADDNAGSIDFLLTKGCPFVTAVYHDLTPAFNMAVSSVGKINSEDCSKGCAGVQGVAVDGGVLKYKIELVLGLNASYTYLVYASDELSLDVEVDDQNLARHVKATRAAARDVTVRVAVMESLFIPVINATLPTSFDPRWSSIPGKGRMSVDEAALDAAANTYPHVAQRSQSVSFGHSDDATDLKVQLSWDTKCMVAGCSPDDLLLLALPHHQHFSAADGAQVEVRAVQYPLVLGIATAWRGATWRLSYPIVETTSPVMGNAIQNHFAGRLSYTTADIDDNTDPFFSKNRIPTDKRDIVRNALRADMAYWTNVENGKTQRSPQSMFMGSDLYAFGKFMGAVARLTLIADELGEARVARVGRDFVRCRLNQWFDPLQEASKYFPFTGQNFPNGGALRGGVWMYDKTWGGLPTGNGLKHPGPDWVMNDTQPDFGSGGYNDHMFHNGYFLYSIAVVLMGGDGSVAPGEAGLMFDDTTCRNMKLSDAEWFAPLQDRMMSLVRDIANPDQEADPFFPKFRHRSDWYVSHTWARGLFPSGLGSSNLESTSEAVQAWYSMFLIGYALKKHSHAFAAASAALTTESRSVAQVRAANDGVADALMNAGAVLLVTEAASVSWYFHLRVDSNDERRRDLFPRDVQSLGVNGNIWGFATNYQAFFEYGRCQWVGGIPTREGDSCPYDLELEQIHWFNRLFILQIQLLPYTPATEMLIEEEWLPGAVKTERFTYTNKRGVRSHGYDPTALWDDLPSAYTRCNGTTETSGKRCTQGWMGYAYQTLAAVDGDGKRQAWNKALEMEGVADGGTLTNLLWWIASRDD